MYVCMCSIGITGWEKLGGLACFYATRILDDVISDFVMNSLRWAIPPQTIHDSVFFLLIWIRCCLGLLEDGESAFEVGFVVVGMVSYIFFFLLDWP